MNCKSQLPPYLEQQLQNVLLKLKSCNRAPVVQIEAPVAKFCTSWSLTKPSLKRSHLSKLRAFVRLLRV